jgi:hypothetical protein
LASTSSTNVTSIVRPGHHCISGNAVKRAFKLADGAGQAAGKEFDHRARHVDARKHRQFRIDDVEAKLIFGRVDIGDQAPRQPRQDARCDSVEVLWRAVGGNHQPVSGSDDLVHRVEEFFLRRILARDELDVVDQQQVGRAQPALEPIVSFSFSARTNSTMNFSADIETTRAPGRASRKVWPIACNK